MHFSKYPKGTILEVSIENPHEFSVKDINRYLQLVEKPYLTKGEQAEFIRIRRAMANAIQCTDCNIEIDGSMLLITVL